jgi:hypothetical protein
MRTRLLSLAGLVVGGLFLWLAMRSIDLREVWAVMLRAEPTALVAALGTFSTFALVKAWRWQFLLRPLCDIATVRLLAPVIAGLAGNAVIAHSGELARGYLVSRQQQLHVSSLLATIAVERVFDFMAVLILLIVAAVVEPQFPDALLGASYVVGGAVVFLAAAGGALLLFTDSAVALIERASTPLPAKWRTFVLAEVHKGIAGIVAARQPRLLAIVLVLSLLQWSLMAATVYLPIASLGSDVPWSAGITVLALIVVGLTAPTAPGYVGTIQLCFTLGLAAYPVAAADAVAASILFNAIATVPVLAIGIPLLHRLGYQLRDAAANSPQVRPGSTPAARTGGDD